MGIFLSLGLQTLVFPDSPCVWVPGAFPLPHHLLPSLLSHAKDRVGTGGPSLSPLPPPTWASFPGKQWDPEQDCFMQIPISVCRQSLEDERRNNYQIMHVALPFLNPEPLKEKEKTKQQNRVGCV